MRTESILQAVLYSKDANSYGNTIEEAIENIKEVIELCLEETKEDLGISFYDFIEKFENFRG